jgi:hypothetical protein
MDGPAGDVLYTSYLSMARAGLTSVEFWDPKSQKWGQPHCQARFAILKVRLAEWIMKSAYLLTQPSHSSRLVTISANWRTRTTTSPTSLFNLTVLKS